MKTKDSTMKTTEEINDEIKILKNRIQDLECLKDESKGLDILNSGLLSKIVWDLNKGYYSRHIPSYEIRANTYEPNYNKISAKIYDLADVAYHGNVNIFSEEYDDKILVTFSDGDITIYFNSEDDLKRFVEENDLTLSSNLIKESINYCKKKISENKREIEFYENQIKYFNL